MGRGGEEGGDGLADRAQELPTVVEGPAECGGDALVVSCGDGAKYGDALKAMGEAPMADAGEAGRSRQRSHRRASRR